MACNSLPGVHLRCKVTLTWRPQYGTQLPQKHSHGLLPKGQASDWALAVSSSYSSGGEDGYVRIHYFDPQYFEFEFEA